MAEMLVAVAGAAGMAMAVAMAPAVTSYVVRCGAVWFAAMWRGRCGVAWHAVA